MMTIEKYFTYTVNSVFVLTGAISVIVGVILMSFWTDYKPFIADIVWIVPPILLIIGAIVIAMGLFGCTGLPMRHKPTAVTFYIFANIIMFVEIGLGIYWACMWNNYESYLKPHFQRAFDEYPLASQKEAWRVLHTTLPCCGVNGAKDFHTNYTVIPPECCQQSSQRVGARTPTYCPLDRATEMGCQPLLLEKMQSHAYILIATAIICGVLKWIFLLLGFVLKFESMPPTEFKISNAGSAYYFVDENNK